MRPIAAVVALLLASCTNREAPPSEGEAVPHFEGTDTPVLAARLRQGERLTWVLGCRGCHGGNLRGQLWDDDPTTYGIVWAPNLTRSAEKYSSAQLEGIILHGIHPTGRDIYSMPSEMFQRLAPSDHAALIAYLKSLEPVGDPSPVPVLGPKARAQIADGTIKPAAARVRETAAVLPFDAGSQHALGRYIASAACVECHGTQLEGHTGEDGNTPDLAIVSAYSYPEFEALTTIGEAKDQRKIDGLMASVGKHRLSRLTSHERHALYNYLTARAKRPD